MSDSPEKDVLCVEFRQEIPIRRTITVLQGKRKRIRAELQQMIEHMAFLVPSAKAGHATETDREVLEKALGRLGDDTFAQLVLQIMHDNPQSQDE